jgi:DMSO/TMAO reductase YedYZ molybdopterin-dependent catalytic subunit
VPTIYVPGSTRLPTLTPTVDSAPLLTPQATLPIPASVPITPLDQLYLNSYPGKLNADLIERWTLTIDGLVNTPLRLTLDDLRGYPPVEDMRALACISNPVGGGLIGNIVWTGCLLAPILEQAGIQSAVSHVHFEAADGYTTSVTLDRVSQPGVLLVYLANGQPLPMEHGYPARILIPGLYGQKMPKWITRMHFADHDKLGYWEQAHRGWSNTAAARTISQIREPLKSVVERHSPLRLAGFAYAGQEAITRVDIAISEDGTASLQTRDWQPATLIGPPSPLAWTWWIHDWTPPGRGDYAIAVRATDETGFVQQRRVSGLLGQPFPDGTEAIHGLLLRIV